MDKKKKSANVNKILEILRGLEAKPSQQSTPADYSSPKQAGELSPNQTINLEEKNNLIQKERLFRRIQKDFWDVKGQEKVLFSQEERKTKLQVESLQEELKKLAASTNNLAKEVETAAQQTAVEPGVYHLTFFEKIRLMITRFKTQLDESATWLAAFNKRVEKKNFYWGQVKKSGTKFMLSQERYMSTQFG